MCISLVSKSVKLQLCFYVYFQVAGHTAMLTLVLAVDQSSWMMYSVPQVPANYWSATVNQFWAITASTQLMLVWNVKVCLQWSNVFAVFWSSLLNKATWAYFFAIPKRKAKWHDDTTKFCLYKRNHKSMQCEPRGFIKPPFFHISTNDQTGCHWIGSSPTYITSEITFKQCMVLHIYPW